MNTLFIEIENLKLIELMLTTGFLKIMFILWSPVIFTTIVLIIFINNIKEK